MRRRRTPEIIAGRGATSSSNPTAGEGFTVTPSGTGIALITITAPGFRLVAATANVVNVSAAQMTLDAITGNSFVIRAFVAAGSPPVDVNFSFVAVGVQQ